MSEPSFNFWSRPKTIAKGVVGLALGIGVALLMVPSRSTPGAHGLYPGAPERFGTSDAGSTLHREAVVILVTSIPLRDLRRR
jgi:hypothetical protein